MSNENFENFYKFEYILRLVWLTAFNASNDNV